MLVVTLLLVERHHQNKSPDAVARTLLLNLPLFRFQGAHLSTSTPLLLGDVRARAQVVWRERFSTFVPRFW